MNFDPTIIILIAFILIILIFFSFFNSSALSKERLRVLLEKQEDLEKSLSSILEKNFDKIDLKVERTSNENTSNLQKINQFTKNQI